MLKISGEWDELQAQGTVMFIAMVVRNAMEEFHVKYLTDKMMEELNPIIRDAIYTAAYAIAKQKELPHMQEFINITADMVPSYWEWPKLLPWWEETIEYVLEIKK